TGDLARYRVTGELEFLGRLDHQVKIRGLRVELGEVEWALRSHPAVREAVVVAWEVGGNRRLVGYVSGEVTGESLRAHLRQRLVEAMVPWQFVALASLPRTPSGKIDRRALPLPPMPADEPRLLTLPRGPVEELVAGIWSEVLQCPVGAEDNFFELGGHSLLATQVLSRLQETLGAQLPLRALFEAPTVAGFAVRVAAALAADDRPASPPPLLAGLRSGPLPLSFAQERLWFLDQLAPGGWAYNIPAALRLRGRLDIQAMERALVEIVRRHEALRTVFVESGGKPVQVVTAMPEAMASAMAAVMPRIDLSALAGSGAESLRLAREESCRSFDLGAGPLLRTVLVGLGAEEHLLLLTVHHIVADGWSVGVFWRELESLYVAFAAGRRSPLVELPLQYVDFAIWQREWLTGEVLAAQIGFWRARLEGAPRALPLPTDRPRPPVQSFRGAAERVLWSGEEGARLRRMGRAEGATLFMTFMAAWATLLHRMTGEEVLVIGSPVAGRSRPQVEGLIGLFVNTLPLHVDLAGELSWRGLLGRIREETLAAFAHQEVPFERLVESLSPVRDLSRSPLFQVMLVLQDDRRAEPRLAGLEAELVPASSGTSKFDLTLTVSPEASEIAGELEYSTDLFEAPTARRLLGYLRTLLAAAVASPEREIGDLALLGEAERQQLLVEWNETSVERPEEVCLH